MITVKCQHTGFEFEAESKRSKNHPLVAEFLSEASKDNKFYRGVSRIAKQLVQEADGYESVEELMADVRQVYGEWKETGEAKKVRKSHKEMVLAGKKRIAAWERDSKEYDGKTGAW